jgi:hypothetical protein
MSAVPAGHELGLFLLRGVRVEDADADADLGCCAGAGVIVGDPVAVAGLGCIAIHHGATLRGTGRAW